MRLNATIALDGLSTHETEVDEVIERIRRLLLNIDPNADVGVAVELLAMGTEFGAPIDCRPPLTNLIESANQRRQRLLHAYWRQRDQRLFHLSLRVAHAICTMDEAKICRILDEADGTIEALTQA